MSINIDQGTLSNSVAELIAIKTALSQWNLEETEQKKGIIYSDSKFIVD